LSKIPHINFIGIGTKVPAFDPEKLTNSYIRTLSKYSIAERGLYLIVQFTHPRELTELAVKKLFELRKNGILLLNQTPLLKDINDDPVVLAELFSKLVSCGVVPYYLFHCRPVRGNREFMMTIQAGLDVVIETKNKLNGLAKLFKYVGSHSTGKIEIIGKRNNRIILKYHQAVKSSDRERILELSENAYWFDDLTDA
jgi:lysine 2,3-aminomutase